MENNAIYIQNPPISPVVAMEQTLKQLGKEYTKKITVRDDGITETKFDVKGVGEWVCQSKR